MPTININATFDPGERLAVTPAAMKKIDGDYAMAALAQHLKRNWGLVDREDWEANNRAVKDGSRILSAYPLPDEAGDFWIITEAVGDNGRREATTILLPSDY